MHRDAQCSTEEANRQTEWRRQKLEAWGERLKQPHSWLPVFSIKLLISNIWVSLTGETWLLSGVCRGQKFLTQTLNLYETNRRKTQTYFQCFSVESLLFNICVKMTFYKNTDTKNQTWSKVWIKICICVFFVYRWTSCCFYCYTTLI